MRPTSISRAELTGGTNPRPGETGRDNPSIATAHGHGEDDIGALFAASSPDTSSQGLSVTATSSSPSRTTASMSPSTCEASVRKLMKHGRMTK